MEITTGDRSPTEQAIARWAFSIPEGAKQARDILLAF